VGAMHSSPRNSRTGWVHSDYCSVWFDANVVESAPILLGTSQTCDYFSGRPKDPSAQPIEYVRAAALIYYLCNDYWKPKDGGHTALYAASRGDIEQSKESIPPTNNSLLFFECSPHSYHRFVTNPGRARNSIILWLHLPLAEAELRWGTPRRHK
jgi:hypothetical protein